MKNSKLRGLSLWLGVACMISVSEGSILPPGLEIAFNGGFEDPEVVDGVAGYNGWTRSPEVKSVWTGPEVFEGRFSAYLPPQVYAKPGELFIRRTPSIAQDLVTVVGGEYQLQFYATSFNSDSPILVVEINGRRITTGIITVPLGVRWKRFDFPFTADQSLTELRFTNGSFSETGLDGIRVLQTGGPLIRSLPMIDIQPQSQTVESGSSVKLGVGVRRELPVVYQWYFENKALAAETRSAFLIPKVQSADQGTYHVVIKNREGSVQSSPAYLTVNHSTNIPPLISSPIYNQLAGYAVGGKIVLSVEAKSTTSMTYQWYFNGKPLAGETKPILSFDNLQVSHAGDYFVRVTNSFGSAQSPVTHLTVLEAVKLPPSISVQPKDQFIGRGGIMQMSVAAWSPTAAAYQWYFNGQPLAGQTSPILLIVNVQSVHEGAYHIIVTNLDGTVRSSAAFLTVLEPSQLPVIIVPPELLNPVMPIRIGRTFDQTTGGEFPAMKIFPGYSIALRVVVRSESPVTYFWFRGDELVGTETTGVLNIQPVQAARDAAEYRVVAQNLSGSTEARLPYRLSFPILASDWKRGAINFGNSPSGRVFDTDGTTPLGAGFAVQCYAGASPDYLVAVGTPLAFRDGPQAGLFGRIVLEIPDLPPNSTVYVQAKAWEFMKGRSYEEAKDAGGQAGASEIAQTVAGTVDNLLALPSVEIGTFRLKPSLPNQGTFKFSAGRVLTDGRPEWTLSGELGTYLVERKSLSFHWIPISLVTNRTGSVTFEDPLKPSDTTFYRARRYE